MEAAPLGGTPLAVTTMRSAGGDLRMACATGVAAVAALATGAGLAAAGAGFAGATALAGAALAAGLAGLLAATGFVAGFFAVNFGFSTFFGFADFAAARLVGIGVAPGPYSDGGRFAGRGIIPATFCLYSRIKAATLRPFLTMDQGNSTGGAACQPLFRRSTTTVV